ncbi:AAA domain-containing protein [Turicibacter sanguinis]|uniref:AAA domain-containing protein n=1 Tax=Turicibacter sanguinis TaxID=154288 RepID=UPI0018A06BE5|nr:AAA domain-containing protein [Turicibacter sanguinis]MCU7196379.1 AAA domain-containing protein [Turicibacter sanguinis]MCU7201437.1 AAA domain-containing protein [Turicibacter sanguinis]
MEKKVRRLFEYLLALRNLSYEPIRHIQKYEKYWFLDDLEEGFGLYLDGKGDDEQSVIEIHQQSFNADYPPLNELVFQVVTLLDFDYTKESSVSCSDLELLQILKEELEKLRDKVESEIDEEFDLTPWQVFLLSHSSSFIFKEECLEKMDDVLSRIELITSQYKLWLGLWTQWAVIQKRKRQVQKMYDYFFKLMQVFKSEEKSLELMLGIGMLTYPSKSQIYHPLLTTKLELEFDAEKGIAKLIPGGKGYQLELEMLSGIELPNHTEIMKLKDFVADQSINPFVVEEFEPYLRQFIHYIHPNGQYVEKFMSEEGVKYPVVAPRNVLFVRAKSDVLLKEDLKLTLDYIDEGGKIPKTIQSIIGVEGLNLSDEDVLSWKGLGENLLFPLPANEEQKDIARRLENNIAITVQGPPGTGKSHTIVNLISHLLSHGKRILVTSEKDKALRVLMDKLPEEIQPLCVSLLGGDRQSLNQIEQSIRGISEGLAVYDSQILEKEIQVLSRQLDMIRRQMNMTRNNIIRFRELDSKGYPWKEKMSQPYEMAQLFFEKSAQYHWVKDLIEMNATCPLSDEQFVTLWELKCHLPRMHKEIIHSHFPNLSRVLSIEEYRHLLKEEQGYLTRLEELKVFDDLYEFDENRVFLENVHQQLVQLVSKLDKVQDPLEQHILKECLLTDDRYSVWQTVYEHLKQIMVKINEHELKIVNDEVRCEFFDHPKYEQFLMTISEKLHANKPIRGLYLTFNPDLKAFYEKTRVNGHKIETLHDLDCVRLYKEKIELLQQFAAVWNKNLAVNGGALIESNQLLKLFEHHQKLKQLENTLECVERIQALNEYITASTKTFKKIEYENLSQLSHLAYSIELTQVKMRLKGWRDVYQVLLSQYKTNLMNDHMHPLCSKLYESLVEKNHERFSELLVEIKSLIQIKEQYQEFYQLLNTLKVSMPLFANEILGTVGLVESIPGSLQEIFEFGKLQTFLNQLDEWKIGELEMKLSLLEKEEVSIIKQLIFKMTWKNQLERVTPEEDRALQTWMQKMNRIGKGTGRHASKYRREARTEMEKCQSAIPVWIMPVKEAIENFTINPDLFDVVIIDESSQCNLLSLPIFMRAKKAVIVGDDQQISPMMPGISETQVKDLAQRYLYNIEGGSSYDLQTSLYDVACRVFSSKGKLMLKEHFRCVPEIIGFSNALSYHNEMIPLKLPLTSEQFNPPVCAIYIENATRNERKVNHEEAIRIVSDIKEMIQNPAYFHKSIGVISLLGAEQAKYISSLLLDAVGEKVMIERQIICGDAYSFQGDERDIMCLSLVIAPNMRYNTLNKKQYTQRFNVAASRAKCEMRLYHSVTLEELMPEDIRYQLLSYCQNPKPMFVSTSGTCETLFEVDVMKAILSHGYEVTPKVRVGKYQIDLVVEGVRSRLAIECDGDTFYGSEKIEQDMERQRVLERAGWCFLRIRGSVFYRDPEKALKVLWDKLEQLDIKPKN